MTRFADELPSLADEYRRLGYTTFAPVTTAAFRAEQSLNALAVLGDHGTRVVDRSGVPRGLDEGRGRAYWAADGWASLLEWPDLWHCYAKMTALLQQVVAHDVICSPHYRSAITVKAYGDYDFHGPHLDTNPLTVLMFLSRGDPTIVAGRDGRERAVSPVPGSLLIMAGKQLRHAVAAVPRRVPRLVVAFNYYTPTDIWRPDDMDEVVYGH